MPEPNPAAGVPAAWRDAEAVRERPRRAALAQRRRMHRRLVLMLVVLGLLLSVFVWLSPVPLPYFAGFWITDYQARLIPLPPQLHHDRDALNQGNYFPRRSPHAFQGPEKAALVQDLSELAQRDRLDTVVVYLAGQARCGSQGETYVFPTDANPAQPSSWLPLRQVLEMLKACPSRSKLLVLDIMPSLADVRLGILSDDIGWSVQHDLRAVDDPDRLVLCAASPSQTALASRVMGRTVFGYYLEEALRGWADGYAGKSVPDRRVSVRELADFLQARVDRWAWQNRQHRQTPVLLGNSGDFPLLVLSQGQPRPHLTSVAETPYPTWLLDGWKLHETWTTEQVQRTLPHLFRELEAALLAAEREWVNGIDPSRSRINRSQQLKELEVRRKLFRRPPDAEPFSLAQAVAQGRIPDQATYDLLHDLLAKIKPGPPPVASPAAGGTGSSSPALDKPMLEALEKIRAKPHFDVAWAAFELTAADAVPSPPRIRWLNDLLQSQEARPRYVETLFLQRLQTLADQVGDNWPADLVRRALEAVRLGEQAASWPQAFAWIRGPLEEASQQRYEAETRLFARGYATLDGIATQLDQAIAGFEVCLAQMGTIQRAQQVLDDAFAFLPSAAAYVEHIPSYETDWRGAVQAADALYRLLYAAPAGKSGRVLSPDELRQQGEDIRNQAEELQGRLDELRQPFQAQAVAAFKDAGIRQDTGTFHLLAIEGLLSVPFWKAADRQTLWKAHEALARRLHQQTRALDEAEDAGQQSITVHFGMGGSLTRQAHEQRERTARRARLALALLQLAGLPSAERETLQALLNQAEQPGASAPAPWYPLGEALRRVWTERLPALIATSQDEAIRDRLSRVFSFTELGLIQPETTTNPQIQLYQRQARNLYGWLADHYRYVSRDSLNLGPNFSEVAAFAAAAARSFQQLAAPLSEETFVQIEGQSEPVAFSAEASSARATVSLRLFAPSTARTDAVLRLFTADHAWLRVTPEINNVSPGTNEVPLNLAFAATTDVPLRLDLRPGAVQARVPPPAGLLLQVAVGGRSYHRLVPVSLQSVTDRLEILLSADPKEPTAPLGELRLRPVPTRQAFYLYVRNPTDKARSLLVQLRVNDALLENGETKLAIGPRATVRVVFPKPLAPLLPPPGSGSNAGAGSQALAGELAALQGPLEVRLLDAVDKNVPPESRLIPVGVAAPREYVQVTSILFTPPQAKDRAFEAGRNRLRVNLRTSLPGGPPCLAELVLPPDRIPGLLGVKDGNFRGEVPFNGQELSLYADNVQLLPGEEETGYVYLHVDGYQRAFVFETTFARSGDATTPREDTQPAVRLRAPAFGVTGTKLPVVIEVDNAPAGATLEVSLGRTLAGDVEAESAQRFPAGRQTRIGFQPWSADGALLFEASIRDWHIELDTLRIKGPRTLLARLLDRNGKLVRSDLRTIVLDDGPAEKVQFVEPPKQARKDAPLTLKAFGQAPVAGIAEVNFFFGRPKDNQPPPNTPLFAGEPVDETRTVWGVKIPLTGEHKGPTDISVAFKSRAGLVSCATTTIDLTEGDPPKEPGTIEGRVLEGPRPQAGLEVILLDLQGKERSRTKTDPQGSFRFPDLPPGKYRVQSAKPVSKRKGEATVIVEPGQTAKVEISLQI